MVDMKRADSEVDEDKGKAPEHRSSNYVVHGQVIEARPIEPGLHVVATPIGHLDDITLRALNVLASADRLACEDTRVTRKLLDRYGIAARPVAYHEHNANRITPELLAFMQAGNSLALVSDAGTPLLCDPGQRLVEAAIAAAINVYPVPGASAALAGLVASGLASDSFFFAGFLPARDKARRDRLGMLKTVPGTVVLFESPHRIVATLAAAAEIFGAQCQAAVCRELTKRHEEIVRGTLDDLTRDLAGRASIRGEIVLILGSAEDRPESNCQNLSDGELDQLLLDLSESLAPAKAAAEAARRSGLDRRMLYHRLMGLRKGG